MNIKKTERIAKIIGVGTHPADGHTRLTQGGDFEIYQGSEQSHEDMRRICQRIEETLRQAGRRLDELSREEFIELAADLEENGEPGRDGSDTPS